MPPIDAFSFASSAALDLPVSIRIASLDGDETPFLDSALLQTPALRHVGANTGPHSDLYVTVQVWAGSKPLTVPVQTAYRAFKNERRWDQWLTLPVRYATLPGNACIAITIWDVSPDGPVPFGGTTVPLFDADNQLYKGRYKCIVHRLVAADGLEATTTPAFDPKAAKEAGAADPDLAEMDRMDGLFKKLEMGEISSVEWLDNLVYRTAENRARRHNAALKLAGGAGTISTTDANGTIDITARPGPSRFRLNIQLPRFDHPVVFVDHEYAPPPVSNLQLSASAPSVPSAQALKPPPAVHYGPGIDHVGDALEGRLVAVYDPEVGARDNPAESKHRRLVRRQHRHGMLDKDLKPNAKVRDELNSITAYPPTQALTNDENDLVWKFRYHLTREKKAVTKFVKSVSWQDAAEAKQAVQVLARWTSIDVDDALELLGPTFVHPAVRAYAVDRLRQADDGELRLYLLQLVQALKFEHISANSGRGASHASHESRESPLARFLIGRAAQSLALGSSFYWYLMVECDDHSMEQTPENRAVYRKVAFDFMRALEDREGGAAMRVTLRRQAEWVAVMAKLAGEVRDANETVARRVEHARHFLQDPENELLTLDPPLPLPLDPEVEIVGVVADDVAVFKSSLHPIKVSFRDAAGRAYPILFKMGDDMRQDQLVIQIITLMDRLLQKEGLDLRLSPYKILATSTRMGLTQFVQSVSFQSLATKYKGAPTAALSYLREHNADANAPLGVRRDALDTFVKSCAGYCVITYILGVGDRHLDNLLLAPDGHFFHIDFGFILGRDPKPFAPAMKLSKEMVETMGGVGSPHYRQFKQYCFLAYTTLRKSSNLILNLFSLMVDANIPDILWEPDKTVLKVQERFHLELSEEDAIRHFERVMDDNLNAFVPIVIDRLHGIVQAWRE